MGVNNTARVPPAPPIASSNRLEELMGMLLKALSATSSSPSAAPNVASSRTSSSAYTRYVNLGNCTQNVHGAMTDSSTTTSSSTTSAPHRIINMDMYGKIDVFPNRLVMYTGSADSEDGVSSVEEYFCRVDPSTGKIFFAGNSDYPHMEVSSQDKIFVFLSATEKLTFNRYKPKPKKPYKR
jgi:hypothetical protein